MNYLLRRAVIDDAEAIASVNVQTWKTNYRGLITQSYLDALTVESRLDSGRRSLLREELDTFVVVEKKSNNVIGFIRLGPCREKNVAADAEMYSIYILEQHQGHGLGKWLFDEGVKSLRARGYSRMMVSVFRDNESGNKFYSGRGGRLDRPDHFDLEGVRYYTNTYIWDL